MAAPPLSSGCATTRILDEQFLSPIPVVSPSPLLSFGIIGDNLLSSNPISMTPDQFYAWAMNLYASGEVIEIFSSTALGDIKTELEELCSRVSCDESLNATIAGLKKALDVTRVH